MEPVRGILRIDNGTDSFIYHPWDASGIFTDPWMVDVYIFCMVNIGKYASAMDAMGLEQNYNLKCQIDANGV